MNNNFNNDLDNDLFFDEPLDFTKNDMDYSNSVNDVSNTDTFINNETAIEYLDIFYNNCVSNSKKPKKHYFNKNIIYFIGFPLAFLLIIIGVNLTGSASNLYLVGILMFFGLLVFAVLSETINIDKKKNKSDNFTAEPDYSYLQKYLDCVNRKKFAEFNEFSYCLTRKITSAERNFTKESEHFFIRILLFTALPAMIVGLFFSYRKFTDRLDIVLCCFLLLLFGCIGIGFLVFGVLKHFFAVKTYNENVDAVCVELNKDITHELSGNHTYIYKPVYYAKCMNGHKYILFNNKYSNISIPAIGDIVKLKVKSSNPIEWSPANYFKMYSFYFTLGLGFSAAGFGTLIWILLSASI